MKLELAVIAAALVVSTAAQASPNLVANGSFEAGPAGLGSFDGWTVVAGDPATFVDSDGVTGTRFGDATDGLWSAFFGSTAASGGASISQVLSTVGGQRYVLGFDLANDNGGLAAANAFTASLDGTSLYAVSGTPAADYVHVAVSFVATGGSQSLRFAAFNDNGYLDLDRVTILAVPEPGVAALVASGAALMAMVRRRRR